MTPGGTQSVSRTSPGTVATFYSFKGGVGRSMTLANVAALLSKWGQRVLITDWDLEAPGIEKFFDKWMLESAGPKDGIVDLIGAYSSGSPVDWRSCVAKARPQGGQEIHIITAGKQDGRYVSRLRALGWEKLFEENRLGNYLETLRREWKAEYDFVLVDSRTGVTDIGGICTIHLPDLLIAMFVANDQSLQGVRTVLESAGRGHATMPVDRTKLMVIPVPSRDESSSEHDLAEQWRQRFAGELRTFLVDWVPRNEKHTDVLNYLKIPYFPYWSFGERLPVLEQDDPENPKTLAYAYQPLAKLLLSGLDWNEVRRGTLSTERALEQAAEAEKLKLEATRVAEEAKRRAAEQATKQMEEAAADRKKRIDEFEGRVQDRIAYWDAIARRQRSRAGLASSISIIAASAALGLLVFYLIAVGWRGPGVIVSIIGFFVLAGAASAFLTTLTPAKKAQAAARLASELESEQARFRSRALPYSGDDPERVLQRYVSNIEKILRRGQEAYEGQGREAQRAFPASAEPANGGASSTETEVQVSTATASGTAQAASVLEREASPTDYQFDVYLSYRRLEFSFQWLAEFLPLFTFWLGESLGRDAVVFDDRQLPAASPWKENLESALGSSRTLLAVCSPSYFQSRSDVREWEYFRQRAPQSIVALWYGGPSFHPDPEVPFSDFTRFSFIGQGFRQSELYVDFQRAVQDLANTAAEKIRNAPPFTADTTP
jgi:TIR domain/CobQ/CobB/MinD/ParA nucleotide binding domain